MQASQEERLKQKLLDEQFALLQGTITEAEDIIQDAVAKLDDPLHVRCTSSPGQTLNHKQKGKKNKTVKVKYDCLKVNKGPGFKLYSAQALILFSEHRLPHQSGGGHTELHRQSETRPGGLSEEYGG